MSNKSRGGKSGQTPDGYVRLSAYIPKHLHLKLKVMSAMEERPIQDIVEESISKAVEEETA